MEFQHCNHFFVLTPNHTNTRPLDIELCVHTGASVGHLMYEEAKGREVTPETVWKLCRPLVELLGTSATFSS